MNARGTGVRAAESVKTMSDRLERVYRSRVYDIVRLVSSRLVLSRLARATSRVSRSKRARRRLAPAAQVQSS